MSPEKPAVSRRQAFFIHLGISLAIFAAVLGLLILVWYPWPLFDLEGGWKGVRLVALVDIVLGPALTLVLFKPGKPGLKFDMSLVVLMQVGALVYGMWNLYEARPVMLVHADDHVQALSRARLAEIDSSGAALDKWEALTPRWISVDLPLDPIEFADVFTSTYDSPGGVHGLVERYRPLHERWRQVLPSAVRIEPYVAGNESWQQRLSELIQSLDRPVTELAFLPYIGRRDRLFLAFDRVSMEVVGVLDVPYDPALAQPEVPRSARTDTEQAPR